ncbi:MAG: glycosyltransferase family 2 protein [Clostridiales bacterium]|nr:glycosyltransferase family 2 protein [Clostridiales bacterium]
MPAMLSACLVLYHCGDEIDHALRCIQASDLEVAVYLVDNSPEDTTADRLKWAFPGVTVIPQKKNVGFGRANNAVLPLLQSNYHLMMNPDVTFDPSLLRRMVSYMENHPNIAILTPRVLNTDGTEQYLPKKRISVHYLLGGYLENLGGIFRRWRREFTMADREITIPIPVEFATGCFLLIRTDVFRQLEGFDPHFFLYQEDTDLSRRVLEEKLGSIVYHPDMCVTHRWARENTRTFRGRMRQVRSVIRYFMKWGISL